MAKYVRIKLPIGNPNATLDLCDSIIEKDTADGLNSSLAGVIDMAAFAAKVAEARSKRKDADLKTKSALDKYAQAAGLAGLGKGQTKEVTGTIFWYIRQIKALLLVMSGLNKKELVSYGFNVVLSTTGARLNVRVTLPKLLKPMVELGQLIVENHTSLGAASPLQPPVIDIAPFITAVNDAAILLHDWGILRGEVEARHEQGLNIIGYDKGQTASTPDTLYHYILNIRDRLLQKYQGSEEHINHWGFKVVVTEATPGRKKKLNVAATT